MSVTNLIYNVRRWSSALGLVGILSASLSGCGGGGDSGTPVPIPGSTANLPVGPGRSLPVTQLSTSGRDVCTANAIQSGKAKWTILVYMNASNNLQPDSLLNVAQLAAVGSDSNVNIVLQWKQSNAADSGSPTFIGTRRYYIKQHSGSDVNALLKGTTTVLDRDRIADPATNAGGAQSDMGSYLTLKDFVSWGSRAYPATNLAVVVWDHGSGWLNAPSYSRAAIRKIRAAKRSHFSRAVSQDNETNNEIETWQLPLALGTTAAPVAAQPIDALIVDCSLESMVEVAYEVRNSARIFVGSEESPPSTGYPYNEWITDLKANQNDPCTVGASIVKRFINFYPNAKYQFDDNVTQAVLDMHKMDAVASALNTFGQALLTHVSDQTAVIRGARRTAHHYGDPYYTENKDLYDYAGLILNGYTGTDAYGNAISFTGATAADLRSAAQAVQAALVGTSGAVLTNGVGTSQSNSHGLAIYVPEPGVNSDSNPSGYVSTYANLQLAKVGAPKWAQFIQAQQQ